ncbi:MAG: hypothetical protein EHM33_05995 [Chloroflexi bacterium]|nr:MAG: hypothetical protein EHM33_05995 [Chloroflexota bacterium]
MNAVELEKELWKINNELVKAGIFPREYPTMHEAVAELVNRYKAAQQSAKRIGGTVCAECGRPAKGHDKIGVRHVFTPANR